MSTTLRGRPCAAAAQGAERRAQSPRGGRLSGCFRGEERVICRSRISSRQTPDTRAPGHGTETETDNSKTKARYGAAPVLGAVRHATRLERTCHISHDCSGLRLLVEQCRSLNRCVRRGSCPLQRFGRSLTRRASLHGRFRRVCTSQRAAVDNSTTASRLLSIARSQSHPAMSYLDANAGRRKPCLLPVLVVPTVVVPGS